MDKLRVFTTFEQKTTSVQKKGKGKRSRKSKKVELPAKERLSSSEIRDKVSKHFGAKKSNSFSKVSNKGQALGAGYMNGDFADGKKPVLRPKQAPVAGPEDTKDAQGESNNESKEVESSEPGRPSDVGSNNPADAMTQEKLKSALSTGAFSFNPKEQEVLASILNGSA